MGDGNIKVGLIVDEAASDEQVEALTAIATGAAGGPMAALAPLVGSVAGVERRPVRFEADGLRREASAGELINRPPRACRASARPARRSAWSAPAPPVSSRLALAKATRSSFHAFGIDWDDATGNRNAHFSPFAWSA